MREVLAGLGDELLYGLVDSRGYGRLVVSMLLHGLLLSLLDDGCHILHILKECNRKPLAREFLATVHSPVSVLEVVMLHGAELLDVAVSAVVVGQQETFSRDYLSCTSASELHDRVLERSVVDVIYLLRGKLASELLHGLAVHLLDERQQPHSLVGKHAAGKNCHSCDDADYLFHIINICFSCHSDLVEESKTMSVPIVSNESSCDGEAYSHAL